MFKDELIQILLKLFPKIALIYLFYEAIFTLLPKSPQNSAEKVNQFPLNINAKILNEILSNNGITHYNQEGLIPGDGMMVQHVKIH